MKARSNNKKLIKNDAAMNTWARLPLIALGMGIMILSIKLVAYWLTGSVALLSDALESIINVVTALIALVTIRVAVRAADSNHQFGHSKFEYLSAVIEGILIILTAILIGQQAWQSFDKPSQLESLGLAVLLSLIATAFNAALAWVLVYFGRREQSPALIADGMHLWTDVITTGGVVAGVLLVKYTGWLWLDPLVALVVAVNILWMGWRLLRESVGGLLDESLDSKEIRKLELVITDNIQGALEAHDMRTRKAGRFSFVTFHLVVPGTMSVSNAHKICDHLESAIKNSFQGAVTTIHVEPDDKAHHRGISVTSTH